MDTYYYLTSRSKYFFIGFSVLGTVILIGLFLYISRNFPCLQFYFLGLGLFSIYLLFQTIQKEHMVVSEKGIEFHSPTVVFETKWESLQRISTHWYQGFRQECLIVDNSQVRIRKWSLGSIPAPFEFVPRNTIIPLSCFSENWRDSELGRQIKQYAPHLF